MKRKQVNLELRFKKVKEASKTFMENVGDWFDDVQDCSKQIVKNIFNQMASSTEGVPMGNMFEKSLELPEKITPGMVGDFISERTFFQGNPMIDGSLNSIDQVVLSDRQKIELEALINAPNTPQGILSRAKIIFYLADGKSKYRINRDTGLPYTTINRWERRWIKLQSNLFLIEEKGTAGALKKAFLEILSDAKRSGAPSTFTEEQIIQIIALACTPPSDVGVEVSHWSIRLLAKSAVELGIVESISPSQISVFFFFADIKPHRSRYWLNSRARNGENFDKEVKRVCDIYKESLELHKQGVHVISTDEKSGIQALGRPNTAKPMIPGSPEKIEHEYIRHGTLCLTGSFEVATGKMIYHTLAEERKEADFLEHIKNTVASDPEGKWVFVLDQLNTHKSESLVLWVSQAIGFKGDLGKKRKSGVLKSMESRKNFLEDETHRIRFIFTPKHTSWLNQIEIWFSILSKRLLNRACFSSIAELERRINGFIAFFNKHLSKPFKWTYEGAVLRF